MSKPIIAVDIDDVLSNNAESFIAFANRHYGTKLTVDDYTEDWLSVWQVDLSEGQRRSAEYHASGTISDYSSIKGSQEALLYLRERFCLIAVTSRKSIIKVETEAWIDEHYPGVFEKLAFAGIYDVPYHDKIDQETKADILKKHGARYFIDDQLKHCLAAAELGMEVVLFGEYAWNRQDKLPAGVTRCKDWAAVEAYFDGRS